LPEEVKVPQDETKIPTWNKLIDFTGQKR
jgi:hypothetical protein